MGRLRSLNSLLGACEAAALSATHDVGRQFDRLIHTRRDYPVPYSPRQGVGPLADCLVGHAKHFGSGSSCASKEVYGDLTLHAAH